MLNRKRIEPGPGQESVWDYPRPPRLEDSSKQIRIIFNDVVIVDTQRAKRILETSHPPVYYIPPEDIQMEYLTVSTRNSWGSPSRLESRKISMPSPSTSMSGARISMSQR